MSVTPRTYDEQELVKDLQRGKSSAFIELYNRHHAALYNYALRFVKVPAIAEDVFKNVFLKIWEVRKKKLAQALRHTYIASAAIAQAAESISLVQQCPGNQFILDHLGNPGIATHDFDGFKKNIKSFAAYPNVAAIFSN
ncbi:MAG: sigma factor [Ferruginibacter sp.]